MSVEDLHVSPLHEDEWQVERESGEEIGTYPSKEAALRVAERLAKTDHANLFIHAGDGEIEEERVP